MARLTAAERAALPDRAFAHVDRKGRRRLPIYDAPHVRNALSRFNQVEFDTEAERDRARRRLLSAARRFRIVPVGFIDRQLRAERDARAAPPELPGGFVTMLMTDIEGSTQLLASLGDEYPSLLDEVRDIHRVEIVRFGGLVVDMHADDVFAVFVDPSDAISATLAIHRRFAGTDWPEGHSVCVRAGVHAGYPTVRAGNYVGMAVHQTARISEAAHGGQLLVSDDTKVALDGAFPMGVRLRGKGTHRLRGIPESVRVHQVVADGLRNRFPPVRS